MSTRSDARRRLPPAHWGLLAVTLLAILGALLLQGLSAGVGQARTAGNVNGAASVRGGGPVIFSDGGRLTSRGLPERTVALTFDDGPDPTWTPRVLGVLAREHVPATFFAVGSRSAEHPELVRRILDSGSELGNHTWSHAQLDVTPAWRRNLELSLTQLGFAGSGSVTTALLRPPYSSTPAALTKQEVATTVRTATRAGYLVVLSDVDTEDWRRPGVDRIVAAGTPTDAKGRIVLMHDGGGNRAETVAALPRLIDAFRAKGFRFTTVSGGLGLAPTAADEPVAPLVHAQGVGLLWALRLSNGLVHVVTWLVIPLGVLAMLRALLVALVAHRHVRVSAGRVAGEPWLPPVSVLVPAYNEEVGIAQAVRSLAASHYPALEIVVVDDGSTDRTAEIVEQLGLPNIRLIRQVNGGKAAALRTGTREASHDILVMLDGDTVFEPDTIHNIVQPLRDPKVGAVSGNVKVGNRKGLLGRWQHLEYVAGFNLDRRLLDLLQCITTVPGAAGAFRRDAVEAAGGLSTDTLAEDTDLTLAITRAGYRVVHEERARAWTEAPSSLTDLWRQRYRWAYGTLQVVWKHRRALLGRGEDRRLGWIALPSLLVLQVIAPVLSPVIDLFAIYGLIAGNLTTVLLAWGGFTLLQVAMAGYALHLDKESLRPLWSLPLQQFVYRQLIYLVVIRSLVSVADGAHLPWHKLERTGDVTVPA